MRRSELEHVVRAAAAVLRVDELIVVGSQAILATATELDLPDEATMSFEADLLPFDDGQHELADTIDAVIGDGSMFQQTHGSYGQGVSEGTIKAPAGWKDRLVPLRVEGHDGPVTAWCMEAHDLVATRALVGREKDRSFCRAVISAGIVDAAVVAARVRDAPGTDTTRVPTCVPSHAATCSAH